ncbi:thioesterase II family protein [Pantoea sp. 1.19]|uniref:thioesterase II family protein n=1 Tax=Pantoea sp. 1.19 TaxID=1925589 RepID=UPI0009489F7A|nr:alpha/beta fold hydrolase [Pantoea sp. 1.19]
MKSQPLRTVFAFPHAGAGEGVYRPWARQLAGDPGLRFCPLAIPGRDSLSQEKPPTDLMTLVWRLAEQIDGLLTSSEQSGGDFITFGHSFGGVISLLVTDVLATTFQRQPSFSILSGSVAPSIQTEDDRHQWSDAQILARIREDKGTPEAILNEAAMARRLVTAMRTDYLLRQQFLRYRHLQVAQPLVLISAREDVHVPLAAQSAWQQHTRALTEITEIPGGHFAVYQHLNTVNALFHRAGLRSGLPRAAETGEACRYV